MKAMLRGGAIRASLAALLIGSLLIGAGAVLLPGLPIARLASALLICALMPFLLLLFPRRLLRPRTVHYAAGPAGLRLDGRVVRVKQIRRLVWSSRAGQGSPNTAWLLGPNIRPRLVIWPSSVPFGEWLARTALRDSESPEPHPLDVPVGISDRLANSIYLVTVPSAAIVSWLTLLCCYPHLPSGLEILLLALLGPGLLVLLGPGRAFARCNVTLIAALFGFNYIHAMATFFLTFARYVSRFAG